MGNLTVPHDDKMRVLDGHAVDHSTFFETQIPLGMFSDREVKRAAGTRLSDFIPVIDHNRAYVRLSSHFLQRYPALQVGDILRFDVDFQLFKKKSKHNEHDVWASIWLA